MPRNPRLSKALLGLFIILVFTAQPCLGRDGGFAEAAESYITNLSITVRRGPGVDYKIIAFLHPGQGVEVLKGASGWRQVRFGEDRTGWVLEMYLTEQPSIASQAQALLAENERLKGAVAVLEKSNSSLRAYFDNPIQNAPAEVKKKTHPPQELARALTLAKRLLKEERARVQYLKEQRRIENDLNMWFLIGSGMAGIGMVLGVLTYRSRRWFKPKS